MDAPPPQEDLGRFLATAQHLRALGVHVPRIYRADPGSGIALVGDLGDTTYLAAIERNPSSMPELYSAAIDALVRLQSAPEETLRALPAYDEALLRRELGLFEQWYLQRHLSLATGAHQALLEPAKDLLVAHALAQPRVLVHRDYHSRNLMLTQPMPGVLDFQDMVRGALAYDLASLLRDCYVELPEDLQIMCLERYRGGLAQAPGGVRPVPTLQQLRDEIDWAAIQRHLKVLGIFVRLHYRDGRSDYLQYLPRVRAYLVTACARHEPLRPLGELIASLGPADEAAVSRVQQAGGAS